MGTTYAEITLKNAFDSRKAGEGLIKEQDVRSVTVQAMADTGAMQMVITEELREKLGLAITGERVAQVANGQRVCCKVTEPVEIHWKNRDTTLRAMVVPGAETILLGAIPLEDMDLMVNPVTQELVGVHGDQIEVMVLYAAA